MRQFDKAREREIQAASPQTDWERPTYLGKVNPRALEGLLEKPAPKFRVPVSFKIPSTSKKVEFKNAFGEKVTVYVDTIDRNLVFVPKEKKVYRYRLLKKLEPRTLDLYYGVVFNRTVYYYVPDGDEYDALLDGNCSNPNTHYVIDFEGGRMYEHPLGQLQTPMVTSAKIKALLAMIKPAGEFRNYVF